MFSVNLKIIFVTSSIWLWQVQNTQIHYCKSKNNKWNTFSRHSPDQAQCNVTLYASSSKVDEPVLLPVQFTLKWREKRHRRLTYVFNVPSVHYKYNIAKVNELFYCMKKNCFTFTLSKDLFDLDSINLKHCFGNVKTLSITTESY